MFRLVYRAILRLVFRVVCMYNCWCFESYDISYYKSSSFLHWRYSPLWALACRTMSLHFVLSITSSLHLLIPSTWRPLSTSSLHPFLGLPLRLVPSSSWVKIFLGILSSSILSRWPSQLTLCPFINFTIFSPLLNSFSSRFVLLFNSPSSYLGPYRDYQPRFENIPAAPFPLLFVQTSKLQHILFQTEIRMTQFQLFMFFLTGNSKF